jgi:hypothetical protein
MAVWADRDCVFDDIFAACGKRLSMVYFQVWRSIHAPKKRGWF